MTFCYGSPSRFTHSDSPGSAPLEAGCPMSSISESLAHSKRLVPTLSSKPQESWGRTKSSWCPGTSESTTKSCLPQSLWPTQEDPSTLWCGELGSGPRAVRQEACTARLSYTSLGLHTFSQECSFSSLIKVAFLESSANTINHFQAILRDVLSKSQLNMAMPSLEAGHLDSPALQCLLPYPNLQGWGGVYTLLPLERKEASGGATPVQERQWWRGLSLFYRSTVCCKFAFQLLASKSINFSLYFSIYKMIGGRKLNERYILLKSASSKKSKGGDRQGKIKLDPPFEISKRFLTWLFNKCFIESLLWTSLCRCQRAQGKDWSVGATRGLLRTLYQWCL